MAAAPRHFSANPQDLDKLLRQICGIVDSLGILAMRPDCAEYLRSHDINADTEGEPVQIRIARGCGRHWSYNPFYGTGHIRSVAARDRPLHQTTSGVAYVDIVDISDARAPDFTKATLNHLPVFTLERRR